MRNVVASIDVSLDGVIEAPDLWTPRFHDQEHELSVAEELSSCAALLLGRRTYEGLGRWWPTRARRAADLLNELPKYVASTTRAESSSPGVTVLREDIPGAVAELAAAPGDPLLVLGSASLVRSLMPHDLIHALRLRIHPVILGSGKRLFGARPEADLHLVEVRPFRSGVIAVDYEPAINKGEDP